MASFPNTDNLDIPVRGLPAEYVVDLNVVSDIDTTKLDTPVRGLPATYLYVEASTQTKTQLGKARIERIVSGFYYQNFPSGSLPANWQECGNSVWTYNIGSVVQTTVNSGDPNKLLYVADLGQQLTVQASLTIGALGTSDDRIGITILGDNTDQGRGVNLNIRNDNTLQFLEDNIAWGPSASIAPAVGETWILKARYLSGVFYGKAWKSGTVEPDWMITWTLTPASRYKYAGITGNSANKTSYATYTDFYVVALPSIQGRARITATTPKTQSGIARITNTAIQTITGLARITVITTRTIAALSRVTVQTLRTQLGLSRITAVTTRTMQGIARITVTTPQTTSAQSRITVRRPQPQAGISRILISVQQTTEGKARLTNLPTRTIVGTANIKSAWGISRKTSSNDVYLGKLLNKLEDEYYNV